MNVVNTNSTLGILNSVNLYLWVTSYYTSYYEQINTLTQQQTLNEITNLYMQYNNLTGSTVLSSANGTGYTVNAYNNSISVQSEIDNTINNNKSMVLQFTSVANGNVNNSCSTLISADANTWWITVTQICYEIG